MSTPRRNRSRAGAPTPNCRGWATGRSAGSSTMPPSSPRAKSAAARRYDGILLDPPKFGRGPKAKCGGWRSISRRLLADCVRLLDADSRFLVLTVYAVRMSALSIGELLAPADGPSRRRRSNAARWRCAKKRAACCCRRRSSPAGWTRSCARAHRRTRRRTARPRRVSNATAASSLSAPPRPTPDGRRAEDQQRHCQRHQQQSRQRPGARQARGQRRHRHRQRGQRRRPDRQRHQRPRQRRARRALPARCAGTAAISSNGPKVSQ